MRKFLTVLIVLGVKGILAQPHVLTAINPWHGVQFLWHAGYHGFVVIGSVAIVGSVASIATKLENAWRRGTRMEGMRVKLEMEMKMEMGAWVSRERESGDEIQRAGVRGRESGRARVGKGEGRGTRVRGRGSEFDES